VFSQVIVKTTQGKKLLAAFKKQIRIGHNCWLIILRVIIAFFFWFPISKSGE
jgi:hypothetical protein